MPLYTAQWSDPAAISSSPPAPWSSSSSDWPNTAAASSTQAAAWSSSMPDWSDAAAAASTPAVSATPSYQPAAASTIGPSLTVTSPASASTCVTYDPCNLFYQVSRKKRTQSVQLYLLSVVCHCPLLARPISKHGLPWPRNDHSCQSTWAYSSVSKFIRHLRLHHSQQWLLNDWQHLRLDYRFLRPRRTINNRLEWFRSSLQFRRSSMWPCR